MQSPNREGQNRRRTRIGEGPWQ